MVSDSFLNLSGHVYTSPTPTLSVPFIVKHVKCILYFVSVNSYIWSLYGCDEAGAVPEGFYLWCYFSMCIMIFWV